jgi:hypothetical protein
MRSTSYAVISAVALGAGLYEGSIAGSLPEIFTYVHPVLPLLVIFFLVKRPQAAYLTAGIAGLTVDLISPIPTGFAMARWLVAAYCIDLVSEHVITNRSLYGAWALAIVARMAEMMILGLTYIFFIYILERSLIMQSYKIYLYSILLDLVIVSLMFLTTSLFTKRFLTFIPFIKGRYGG